MGGGLVFFHKYAFRRFIYFDHSGKFGRPIFCRTLKFLHISNVSCRDICFLPYALQTSSYDTNSSRGTNFRRAWSNTNGGQLMPDSTNSSSSSTSGSSSTSSSSSNGSGDGDMKKKPSKKKTFWVCDDCGDSFVQWWGACQSCKKVNTLKRFTASSALETQFADSVVSGVAADNLQPQLSSDGIQGLNEEQSRFPAFGYLKTKTEEQRPTSELRSVVVYNTKDDNETWIPLSLSVGSWVTIEPLIRQKRRVKLQCFGDINYHWKGIIRAFKMSKDGQKVEKVRVAHVYDHTAIMKEEISKQPNFPKIECNCLCVSNWEKWELIESVTGVLQVFHSQIGELLYAGQSPTWLKNEGVWFYKYNYFLPQSSLHGHLEENILPSLNTLEWQHNGETVQAIINSFRFKLFSDVQGGMKENGSVRVRFDIFMPFYIFIYFFHNEESIRRIKKTYNTSTPSDSLLSKLFHSGWDKREHKVNGEVVECRLSHDKMSLRYWVERQILYVSFRFCRWKHVQQGGQMVWVPEEQDGDDKMHSRMVSFDILKHGTCFKTLSVEENWTLFEVRQQLEVEEEMDQFVFLHNGKKVLQRRERHILCKLCGPPSTLEVEEC